MRPYPGACSPTTTGQPESQLAIWLVVPCGNPGRTTLDGYRSGFYDREQMDQAAISASAGSHVDAPGEGIAIVVLTHNRVELLRKCVENVLLRTSDATREIVIWDNASPDATADYLRT